MNLILRRISMGILFILMLGIIIYGALQSDFAQHYKKSDADVYKMKNKAAKRLFYDTSFKRSSENDEILSLGDFTVNLASRKLITKISIATDEDTIEMFMENQSVIRNDVINSIISLKGRTTNQDTIAREIKNTLNSRFKKENIKDVYFEKFLIQ